jgi:hypothetical protein
MGLERHLNNIRSLTALKTPTTKQANNTKGISCILKANILNRIALTGDVSRVFFPFSFLSILRDG